MGLELDDEKRVYHQSGAFLRRQLSHVTRNGTIRFTSNHALP
jgi:hypothetical protein